MKILTRTVAVVFTCTLLFAGCDSLNLQPPDELASEQVWEDPALTKAYLNNVYSSVGMGFGNPMLSSTVDEALHTHGVGGSTVTLSNMTPTDRGKWDVNRTAYASYQWEHVYDQVRDLNIFLQNVEKSEALGSSMKETLMGEAYFLRAFFYHNIMRLYGGGPYITSTFELSGDLGQYQVPRNTFEETVNKIVADLDSAAIRLPLDARTKGTATKGAALALKCRVRVHAASDLFAENPSGMAEIGYTGGSQQDRWQKAKDACQAVMDLDQYRLPQAESAQDYHDDLLREDNPEFIWARYFSEQGGQAHNISQWLSPNGYNSWTGDAPTQQHVNAYEMADGSQFEWKGGDPVRADEPVDAKNPYRDRDLRFYANILYNGADWRPHPPGMSDPKGVIQTGWYEYPGRGGSYDEAGIQGNLRPGLDTREGPVQTWNGTKTGYNLKKFVDRNIDPQNEQAYNPWPFLRYAEVLLNKAEAAANLGNDQEAVQALNKVRSRVGMPDVPVDGGPNRTLMERIRQEREVELAFEEFRYLDVRRWMIAPEVYSEGGGGIRIEGELDESGELLVDHRYEYKYNVFRVDQRAWDNNAYFLPIPRDEMNKNTDLVQNPGY